MFSVKAFVHFKCNNEIDLDFYVRVRTCEKRVTGKQPLDAFLRSVFFLYFIKLSTGVTAFRSCIYN